MRKFLFAIVALGLLSTPAVAADKAPAAQKCDKEQSLSYLQSLVKPGMMVIELTGSGIDAFKRNLAKSGAPHKVVEKTDKITVIVASPTSSVYAESIGDCVEYIVILPNEVIAPLIPKGKDASQEQRKRLKLTVPRDQEDI